MEALKQMKLKRGFYEKKKEPEKTDCSSASLLSSTSYDVGRPICKSVVGNSVSKILAIHRQWNFIHILAAEHDGTSI